MKKTRKTKNRHKMAIRVLTRLIAQKHQENKTNEQKEQNNGKN
ncbi:MAG: hypothetical protein WDA26_06600 [Pusillimonas sp.]